MMPVTLTPELGLLEGQNRHHVFRGQLGRKLIASDDIAKAPCQEEPSEHLARSLLSSVTAGGLRAGSAEGWF